MQIEKFDDFIGGYRAVFWAHAYECGESVYLLLFLLSKAERIYDSLYLANVVVYIGAGYGYLYALDAMRGTKD